MTRERERAQSPNVKVRFAHSQIGMSVYLLPDGGDWTLLDIYKYGDTLDTVRAEKNFLAYLNSKGVSYQVVQS